MQQQPTICCDFDIMQAQSQLMGLVNGYVANYQKYQKFKKEYEVQQFLTSLWSQMAQTQMRPIGLVPNFEADMRNWEIPHRLHGLAHDLGSHLEIDHFTCLMAIICTL